VVNVSGQAPTTEAQSNPTEVDELAKNLPGLPVETKRLRADERGVLVKPGFLGKWRGRSETLVPWSEIVGHGGVRGGWGIQTQGSDECEVHELHVPAGRDARRAIEAAWQEYILRKIERDGVVRGTHVSGANTREGAYMIALGLILFGLSINSIRELIDPLTRGAEVAGIVCMAVVNALVGALAVAGGIRTAKIIRSALLCWYRWELSADGLARWSKDGKQVLAPLPSDTCDFMTTKMGGRLVPLGRLTHSPVLRRFTLGVFARRSGRPPKLGAYAVLGAGVVFLALLTLMLATVAQGRLIPFSDLPYSSVLQVLVIGVLFIFGVLSVVALIGVKRESIKMTAEGRAMLERLGW